jgi:RNA polymerase sigma-70 factor (ECF subfamily)
MNTPEEKFRQLYDTHINKIYRFVFLKVNSRETAEDLTSETFLRIWMTLKAEKKVKNLNAFLYRTAYNLVIDFYRKKEVVVSIENCQEKEIIDNRNNPEGKIFIEEDLNLIKAALSGLKEDYQNVIIWHYLDDLLVQEIAEILNKNDGTVRVLLHRALKELKRGLSDMN